MKPPSLKPDIFVDIIASSLTAILIADEDHVIQYMNSAAELLFGVKSEDVIGRSVTMFIPVEFRDIHEPSRMAALLDRQHAVRRAPALRAGGEVFTAELTLTTAMHEGRKFYALIARDATAEQGREDELAEVRQTLKSLIGGSPLPTLIADKNGVLLEWNRAAEAVLGWSRAEVVGQPNPTVKAEDWPHYRMLLERLMGGETVIDEGWRRHQDGTDRRFVMSASPLHNRDGEVWGYASVGTDITALKEQERKLYMSEQRHREVANAIHDLLFEIDPDAGEMAVSGAVDMVGGQDGDVWSRQMWLSRIHHDDVERVLRHEVEVFSQQRPKWVQEYRFRRADGSYAHVLERGFATYKDGQPVRLLGAWSDVSEQKALEQQLRQAQKMEAIGVLASGIAHDFNNILTAINGFARLLQFEVKEGASRSLLQEIQKASDRAASLTRQLLSFSRREMLNPKVFDLNVLLADIEPMLRRVIGEDILLHVAAHARDSIINTDPGQIEQVILNLVVNARDAMQQGGTLVVETESVVEDHVTLRVRDTGCGMSEEVQAHLFEPFFTTKGQGHGTGLGLATVYGIGKQSGAQIEVESEEGVGTTFSVHFPLEKNPAAHIAHSEYHAMTRQRGEGIMLVEDDSAVRMLVTSVLRSAGYRIFHASNGMDALREMEKCSSEVDLLLTDVVMPHLSGRELAEQITERWPHVRVMYMSGYTDDAIIRYGISEAEVDFIAKPFTPSELVRKLDGLFAKPLI